MSKMYEVENWDEVVRPEDKNKRKKLDDMTEEQWIKCLAKYYKKYEEIFGYIPNESDYSCTREVYAEALLQALKEKKEISEYLKNI